MLKKIILFLLLSFIAVGGGVLAQEEINNDQPYTTRHLAEYKVLDYLNTEVKHTVEITLNDNKSAVRELSIYEPARQIQQIKVTNNTNASVTNNGNEVKINFDKVLVGPGVYSVTYTYNTPDIFTKIGTSYTLNIPQIQDPKKIVDFNLKVFLPQNLPAKYSNYALKKSESGDFLLLNKDDLLKGDSIVFAENMVYSVDINNLVDKQKDYIIIPPNMPGRQQVFLHSISKEPSYVKVDSNGNTYLYYNVKGTEEVETKYYILVEGNELQEKVSKQQHTKSVKNWDHTKGISSEYLKYSTKEKNTSAVENAVDFVTGYLNYTTTKTNYDYVSRIGAENLNESNKDDAVCLEYTDLLISVLRGSNIPSRELSGLAYEQDINSYSIPSLHSWVDYNLNGRWVQTDPTWQDTTGLDYVNAFDYNHIVFLIRSENSEYPLLPGSYTSSNKSEQLKVSALVNVPEKQILYIPRVKLFDISLIKNNTNTFIANIRPRSFGLLDGSYTYNNSYFYDVEFTKMRIQDILGWWSVVLVSVIVFPIFTFVLLHKRLNKKKSQVKSKVSSIG